MTISKALKSLVGQRVTVRSAYIATMGILKINGTLETNNSRSLGHYTLFLSDSADGSRDRAVAYFSPDNVIKVEPVYSVRVDGGTPGSGSEVLARFEVRSVYDVRPSSDSPSGLPTINLR